MNYIILDLKLGAGIDTKFTKTIYGRTDPSSIHLYNIDIKINS